MNDGGPAFAKGLQFDGSGSCANSHAKFIGGMTLRDWFAGQSISDVLHDMMMRPEYAGKAQAEELAKGAYMLADAMLKARDAT